MTENTEKYTDKWDVALKSSSNTIGVGGLWTVSGDPVVDPEESVLRFYDGDQQSALFPMAAVSSAIRHKKTA